MIANLVSEADRLGANLLRLPQGHAPWLHDNNRSWPEAAKLLKMPIFQYQ